MSRSTITEMLEKDRVKNISPDYSKLLQGLSSMDLRTVTYSTLEYYEVTNLFDVLLLGAERIKAIRGIGKNCFHEIKTACENAGFILTEKGYRNTYFNGDLRISVGDLEKLRRDISKEDTLKLLS